MIGIGFSCDMSLSKRGSSRKESHSGDLARSPKVRTKPQGDRSLMEKDQAARGQVAYDQAATSRKGTGRLWRIVAIVDRSSISQGRRTNRSAAESGQDRLIAHLSLTPTPKGTGFLCIKAFMESDCGQSKAISRPLSDWPKDQPET
jgi:hypothetical protein